MGTAAYRGQPDGGISEEERSLTPDHRPLCEFRDHNLFPSLTMPTMRFLLYSCALSLAFSAPACAQEIPKSQLGTISQTIADAQVEIRYRRPVARGRVLFGELVPWGEVWTPSADTAVQVTLSAPVEIEGQTLPAGSYALWAIPDAASWTIIFNSRTPVFHLRYPAEEDMLRVSVTPEEGEHVETLQIAFPLVDGDSALMQIRWGPTIVPLNFRVASRARR